MTSPPPRTRPFAAFFHFVLLPVIIAGIAGIATIAVVCSLDARGILPPAELRSQAENLLFLQGGTDGGGSIFFATLALFGLFHLLSAALLSTLCFDYRRRSCPDAPGPFLRDTLRAAFLSALPYLLLSAYTLLHLLLHCCAASGRSGLASMAYTSSASDSFILAFATLPALCLLTALWTAILARRPWKLHWKLLASPLVVLLWLFLAADGQTPRAGQRLSAFSEPLPAVRSWRHAAMLAWYDLFSSRPAAAPQDAPLWFWTDGQTEFGTRLHDSPSARALPVRSDLPWTAGRPVFVVPLAPGASIFDAMPYYSPSRHLGGYFLQNPDASVIPIRLGVLDPVHPFPGSGPNTLA